jgi:hypothetical protein
MKLLFCLYVTIALVTYSFFALVYLFKPGQKLISSVIFVSLTIGGAIIWPIFYIYLAICNYFKLPSIYIEFFQKE